VTARARQLYEKATRLGGDKIDTQNLWLIEEGIGLAWLMDGNGERALPHLERALEVAARPGDDSRAMLSSTRHNLACAYSLLGEVEKACSQAQDLLTALPEKERKAAIKEIKKDEQLKAMRNDACYKAILADL
jgi:tetratricopeptide (TPR) repeat protein